MGQMKDAAESKKERKADKAKHNPERKAASAERNAKIASNLKNNAKVIRVRSNAKKDALAEYACTLADPWANTSPVCPVSFNPAPSLLNTTARTTSTILNMSVAANLGRQLTFMPGHGDPVKAVQSTIAPAYEILSSMDATAYHCLAAYPTAGGAYTVGPVPSNNSIDSIPCCNAFETQVGVDGYDARTLSCAPIPYDVSLPYNPTVNPAVPAYNNHHRWQLVSMGVRLFNTTPELNRAGNIVTVQFPNANAFPDQFGSQSALEINPSFRTHGDGGDGIELTWTPRLQDLAYWHSVRGPTVDRTATVADTLRSAAMCIFLNNPTSVAQSYTLQVVYNWMLAGSFFQSISGPSLNEPILKAPVEQAVVHLQNTASTAAHAPSVFESVTKSVTAAGSMLGSLASKGYNGLAAAGHVVGAGARIAGQLSRAAARTAGAAAPRLSIKL